MLSHAEHVCLLSPDAWSPQDAGIPPNTTATPLIVNNALPVVIIALECDPLPCPTTLAPTVAIGTPLIVASDCVGWITPPAESTPALAIPAIHHPTIAKPPGAFIVTLPPPIMTLGASILTVDDLLSTLVVFVFTASGVSL